MTDDWGCPHCGASDPHDAIEVMDDEIEVDVTCKSVYVTSTDDRNGFAFDHHVFEQVIRHYQSSEHTSEGHD